MRVVAVTAGEPSLECRLRAIERRMLIVFTVSGDGCVVIMSRRLVAGVIFCFGTRHFDCVL